MPKRKTLYVVTSGCYSDYGIRAIFSTQERAETFMDVFPHAGHNDIQEWYLDPCLPQLRKGHRVWHIIMERDGACSQTHTKGRTAETDAENPLMPLTLKRAKIRDTYWLSGEVFARDGAHAAKIVNEKRVQLIAQNEWHTRAEIEAEGYSGSMAWPPVKQWLPKELRHPSRVERKD